MLTTILRFILPLLVGATLLFTPLLTNEIAGSELGKARVEIIGADLIERPISCVVDLNFAEPISKSCYPYGGWIGWFLIIAIAAAVFAAVFLLFSPLSENFARFGSKAAATIGFASTFSLLAMAGISSELSIGLANWGGFLALAGFLIHIFSRAHRSLS